MTSGTMEEHHDWAANSFQKQTQAERQVFQRAQKAFASNLPEDNDVSEDVTKLLSTCGQVLFSHVYEAKMLNSKSKRMLVVFSSANEALEATKLTGTVVGGNHIIISTFKQYANPSSKAVRISHLSLETNEEDLWQFFENCGKIRFICIERLVNAQSHTAEIHFEDVESAQKCLKHSGKTLKGNKITVSQMSEESSKEFPVHVGGLPNDVTKEDLAELFHGCGPIKRIKIKTLQNGKLANATIFFKGSDSAEKALSHNGNKISGHVLTVTQRQAAAVKQAPSKYTNPLFIAGISRDSKLFELFLHFQDCGFINDVKFVPTPSQFLKKAVIDFKDAESVKKALTMKNLEIRSQTLILSDNVDIFRDEVPCLANKRKYKEINSSIVEQSELKTKRKKGRKSITGSSDAEVDESLSSSVVEQSGSKYEKKGARTSVDSSNGFSVEEQPDLKKVQKKGGKSIGAVHDSLSSSLVIQPNLKKKRKNRKSI